MGRRSMYITLLCSRPFALFSDCKMISGSGNEMYTKDNAHIACSMHFLLTSSKDSDDLSNGFIKIVQPVNRN